MGRSAFNQVATYWEKTGETDRYGKPILSSPVQINCRWEDKQTQIMSKSGNEIISKTRVFTNVPISVDGYLAKGTVATSDPRGLDGATEVQQVSSTPDLRNLESLTTVYL